MQFNPQNPLIVQSDKSILLEVDNPLAADARDSLARFAELEKAPEPHLPSSQAFAANYRTRPK